MSTDIGDPIRVVNPATGEALTLASSTDDLGRWLADVREHELYIREAKNLVQGELLARMDKDARYTVHLPGGLELSGASPEPSVEYDAPALRETLLELVDESVITAEAVDRAVETVVSYKPRKAGITALRKLGGRVRDLVDAHGYPVEKKRYVKVGRS